MRLSPTEARSRLATSPRAILASVHPDGRPHLVPIVFALVGDVAYSAVDHKPKDSVRLQRLENLRREPRCSLLVDHYDDDWSRLWWVRADGTAELLDACANEAGTDAAIGRDALTRRYPAYRAHPPEGPLLRILISRWRGWAAT